MSRKHVIYGFPLFNAVSAATNQISATTHVAQSDKSSMYIFWTSGVGFSGTLTVEARHKNQADTEPWFTIDLGSTVSLSGASGDHQIYLTEMPFDQIRLNFENTAGTATLTATILTKSQGA